MLTPPLTNWAKNLRYRATVLHEPTSTDELRELVAGSRRLRVLGSRHCFNDLADSAELVTLDRLPPVLEIDPGTDASGGRSATVRVGGATRYGTLAAQLHAAGWAVHNLASLPHISVAGAVATATHGSGDRQQNLAGAVVGLELVTADGGDLRLDASHPDWAGAVVGLGALGVVTAVTLRIEPTYDVVQEVSTGLPWDAALAHLDEITASADSVSLFTDWSGPEVAQVWRKTRVPAGGAADGPTSARVRPNLYGAALATTELHPLPGIDPRSTTGQLGVPGPWHERLPHFRMEFTPSHGDELQSEYLVGREHAVEALTALRGLAALITPLLLVSEVRTIARDDLWLSTAQGRDSVALHFTWKPRQPEVEALLPVIEEALAPFDARPHWGKLFSASVAGAPDRLAELYPRLPDFRALATRLDPEGTFHNEYLTRHGLVG